MVKSIAGSGLKPFSVTTGFTEIFCRDLGAGTAKVLGVSDALRIGTGRLATKLFLGRICCFLV
jgi:hypothetical protein